MLKFTTKSASKYMFFYKHKVYKAQISWKLIDCPNCCSELVDFSNLEGTNFKIFFIVIPFTNSHPSGVSQIMKFFLLNILS